MHRHGLIAGLATLSVLIVAAGCGATGQPTAGGTRAAAATGKRRGSRSDQAHRDRRSHFVLLGHFGHVAVFAASSGFACPAKPVTVSRSQAREAGRAVLAVLPKLMRGGYPPANVSGAYIHFDERLSTPGLSRLNRRFLYNVARGCERAVYAATVFVNVRMPHVQSVSVGNQIFFVARVKPGWAIWGSYS